MRNSQLFISISILKSILVLGAFSLCHGGALKIQEGSLLEDSETQDLLKTLCAPALPYLPSSLRLRFYLVYSSEVNAFAAPDGSILINTGFLLNAENPEEVIGVLFHEIGHVVGQHAMKGMEFLKNIQVKSLIPSLLALVAAGLAGGMKNLGASALASLSLGNVWGTNEFTYFRRSHEGAADQFAFQLLQKLQWSAAGFISFMQKLGEKEATYQGIVPLYMRTHPFCQERAQAAQASYNREILARKPLSPTFWKKFYATKIKLLGYTCPLRGGVETVAQADVPEEYKSYGLAVFWYRKGDAHQALKALNQFEKDVGRNAFTLELRAQILFEAQRVQEAWRTIVQALKLRPRDHLIESYRAVIAISLNNPVLLKDSVRSLERLLLKDAGEDQLWYWLAVALGRLGRKGPMYVALAEQAIRQNNLDQARAYLKRAKGLLQPGTPYDHRARDMENMFKNSQ